MAHDSSSFLITPIGEIHSPYKTSRNTPIQARKNLKTNAVIEIFPEYTDGLRDIEGFSHIIVIYRFHQVKSPKLIVSPYLDTTKRGVYATRAPARPNHLGISVVNLVSREGNKLTISGVDMLDGSPVIDLKPFIPQVDQIQPIDSAVKIGWLEDKHERFKVTRDDGRFSP